MKILVIILSQIILLSCSVFKIHTVDKDLRKSTKKICLSSHGKGRLVVQNRKYVFSYESALDNKLANWVLGLNFPLRKTETFTLDWSKSGKVEFKSTIEEKLLKENKNINPMSLEEFTQSLGSLLEEVIKIRTSEKKLEHKFKWSSTHKSVKARSSNKKFDAVFTNLVSDSYFGLMSVKYKDNDKQTYKLDLIVRKCLE